MPPKHVIRAISDVSQSCSGVGLATALAIALYLVTLAHAQAQSAAEFVSVTSSTADQDCRSERPSRRIPDDGGARRCPGPHGLFVFVAEQDLRQTVTVGRNRLNANGELAARQTFGPFNSAATTVEWHGARGRPPVAIIQRWFVADNDDPDKNGRPQNKQLLVVTRLPPGAVCHVAYIDVKANPNANELARKAADTARSFDCAKDQVKIDGVPGRAVELAIPKRQTGS